MSKINTGDEIEYTTLGGKKARYIVQGPSQDGNPGFILKGKNDNRIFAVSGTGVNRMTSVQGNTTSPSTTIIKNVQSNNPSPSNQNAGDGGGAGKLSQGMKQAVKGAAIAAGAVGAAALASGRKTANAAGSAGESVFEGNAGNGLSFLLIAAIITHFADWWVWGFSRPGVILYFYIFMILFTFVIIFRMHVDNSDKIIFLMVILISYFLPLTLLLIKSGPILSWLLTFITIFPILPIFIGLQFPKENIFSKITLAYIIGFLVFISFTSISSLGLAETSKTMITDPLIGLRFFATTASKTFENVGTDIAKAFDKAVAQATGQPYEGDEESRVGIYVEDIKPLESQYNTGSRVYVEAKIVGVNLKENVNVEIFCFIENFRQGTVIPQVMPNVTDNYQNTVDCNLGQLPEGSYEVKIQAIFYFETTSDIQYTFVSNEIKSDQYAKLNIDPVTIATYTGGPVELGLPSLSQPLRVDASSADGGIVSYPFGVSLQNKWPQGKVVKGMRYLLNVPTQVSLVDCTRSYRSMTHNQLTERNEYTFEINTSNTQEIFDAVTCRMRFNDARSLLGTDLKSVKTFAARARYQYMVEGTTSVVIESLQ
jgi:hypothetical protein